MRKLYLLLTAMFMLNVSAFSQRIAVIDFNAGVGISQADVDGISAIFNTYFSPAGYTLVERGRIDRVIDEQQFQRGKLTEQQMVKVGQILNISLATRLAGKIAIKQGSTVLPNQSVSNNGKVINPDGMEMVFVEGTGGGIMGQKSFYIGKYEVTQAQWKAVMGNNPSYFSGENNPVERVSWNDCQEFIKKLNQLTGRTYRLPTEAEWEYAARGGKARETYEYAGSNNIGDVAWYGSNSQGGTHQVGTKKPNSLGIYDMSGNVCEWCQDCYDSSCSSRVLRGGSWGHYAWGCRVANRGDFSPSTRYSVLGFRLVLVQ